MSELSWIDLFEHFLAEPNPTKLELVETAIVERLQALNGTAEGHEERLAIKMAADMLLEIKTTKLGFPPLPGVADLLAGL